MIKKLSSILLALMMVVSLVSTAQAQRLTGSLKGRITDKQGYPLPGAFIYLASPALIGIRNYITSESGHYAFIQLPSGTYKVTVEMPGFKTVNIDNIGMDAGKTLTVDATLESTEIEEEITSLQASPLIDTLSAREAFVADADLLRRAPLARDFSAIMKLAPGVTAAGDSPEAGYSVSGATVRSNTFLFGGVDLTNTLSGIPMATINLDAIEEVEFANTSHPAENPPPNGGFINIVTKSGGNSFLGELGIHHTGKAFSKQLWPAADPDGTRAGASLPAIPKLWDFSLSMGGPIMEDRAWFFSNVRLNLQNRDTSFLPWTDPLGTAHQAYGWKGSDLMTYAKISTQVTPQIRAFVAVDYQNSYQPVYDFQLNAFTPLESSWKLNHDTLFAASGGVNYRMDQDTFVDLAVGFAQNSKPLILNIDGKILPRYTDEATGRVWGSAPFNQTTTNRNLRATASITRIQNGLMGTVHELKAGGEYNDGYEDLSTWKDDNLTMHYLDGSPYLYGTAVSPGTGETVGKGLVSFYIASKDEGATIQKNETKRLSLYAQDAMTIAQRLTLQLGLRFDHSAARIPAYYKRASANAVSIKIGDELIKPIAGLNPYSDISVFEWDKILSWNTFSPRAGLSLDLFGNGRSIVKASFARYPDAMGLNYARGLAILDPTRSHQFYWYDENGNGLVESTDTYALFPDDYRIYMADYSTQRVSPDAKSPSTGEMTFSFHQAVLKDLTVSLAYIGREQKNILDDVLYDPDSGVEWYSANSQQGWWIPFRTVVPAAGGYAETPVTVYFRSNTAPQVFERLQNVPELRRKYGAVELSVRKRMSDRWQFYGSVVWSKATGNIGLAALSSSGFSPVAGTPNSFINVPEDSKLDLDRPAAIRLMGTYAFPKDFYLSLYYSQTSGATWARSVTILPPDSWAAQNNIVTAPATVFLETPGARRFDYRSSLDARIEKELAFRNRKRLTFSLDLFNLLGRKTGMLDLNDGGFWYPGSEDSAEGLRLISPTYKKYLSLSGMRTVQFNLNLQF